MHERKVEMARRSGAFIGLPGGFGTFEEVRSSRLCPNTHADGTCCIAQILEVVTWNQLNIHNKRKADLDFLFATVHLTLFMSRAICRL